MAENFHHGPEIIEHLEGNSVVREVKSAVTFIVGTAPIQEVHDTAEKRAAVTNELVVIRRREQIEELLGPRMAGYSLPEALDVHFNKIQSGKGGGTIVAVNIFNPDLAAHQDEGDPDPSKVTAADAIGTYTAGKPSGFKLARTMFNRLGFFPKILEAPRLSGLVGVRAEMEVQANDLSAVYLADLPAGLTVQQAVETRGATGAYNTSSSRGILLYPHLKAYDPVIDDVALQPYSQHFAGMMVASDLSYGYHYSPSNRAMSDVLGLERDLEFVPGRYDSDQNALNEAGIVTAMNYFGSGYRTWGNRSAGFPTMTTAHQFIHVRRTLDMIHEAALYYLMDKIDRPATKNFLNDIEEDVDAFLRKKEGEGALYGGTFRFDRTKTTSADATDGRFYYRLDCMPVGVTERMTVDSYLDASLAASALGLAA
ncbi:phage tail sheath subtilisin-like domain-containing protein [Ancylobacter sp. A5.8]|uniref:phage tail sheath family protein n=1 Tax=Ancylobacter gelatini TaxID=2919920 RepID=UPI001F4DE39D|nr:phage tail sheath subtilisin-like domain-containing protein [Ancylobacter gelatini]MCJ8142966.1 phage tail sheath subtilisin-like domain-containing protein [Ancylobacter gelatini]